MVPGTLADVYAAANQDRTIIQVKYLRGVRSNVLTDEDIEFDKVRRMMPYSCVGSAFSGRSFRQMEAALP